MRKWRILFTLKGVRTETVVPEAEPLKARQQLEEYCGQDTDGMEWITGALRRLA